MPSYISTQPEIFTKPPQKITSDWRKPGQLTDEQVKQFFDEVSYKQLQLDPFIEKIVHSLNSSLDRSSPCPSVNFEKLTLAQNQNNM